MKAVHKRHIWRLLIGAMVFAFLFAVAWKTYNANQQTGRDDALWTAVERGDLFAVTFLLSEGADPNINEYQILDNRHRTSIAAMASRLLGRRPRYNFDPETKRWTADPRVPGNWTRRQQWNTVLWLATEANRDDIVRALIANGAKDQTTGYLPTALMWAAESGHTDIVHALLANGSDVNATDDFGHAALDGAVIRDNLEIVQLLLQHGADPTRGTALASAKKRGHTTIVTLLETAQSAKANRPLPARRAP